tara:strand:+ start:4507 stop:4710 length:204 start_codon:yes stop_codon:yes gene_type:complete
MEKNYQNCKLIRLQVDTLLQEMASLFTNLGIDSSPEEVKAAYEKEKELIERIAQLDEGKADSLRSSY